MPLAPLALLALAACDSSNPVEPDLRETPGPAPPGVSIQAPGSLETQGSATVTVTVTDPSATASGATVFVSTSLGNFGNDSSGNPIRSGDFTLTPTASGGVVQLTLQAGTATGTANLLAQFGSQVGNARVSIVEPGPVTLTAVTPNTGNAAGGTQVTLTGSGFAEPLEVTFGGVQAQVLSVTSTRLTVLSPALVPAPGSGSATPVAVVVTVEPNGPNTRSATLQNGFVYVPGEGGGEFEQPLIFQVSPSSGPNSGGVPITITGAGFSESPETQVFLGVDLDTVGSAPERVQVAASAVTVSLGSSGTDTITFTQPAASGGFRFLANRSVDIELVDPTSGLTALAQAAFRYGEGGSLVVSGFASSDDASGAHTGGETIILVGQGFGDDPSNLEVSLAGVVQSVGSISGPASDGQQTLTLTLAPVVVTNCSPPSGPAVVTNRQTGETASSPGDFEYTVPMPRVTGVAPDSVSGEGGTTVTVSGSGFSVASSLNESLVVEIAGNRAGSVSVTDDGTVTATAPPFTDFDTEVCDDNMDGVTGTRAIDTAVGVQVTNAGTRCASAVAGGLVTYEPTDTSCIEGQEALDADFTFEVSGTVVAFQNTSTGNPDTFSWEFGDGETSSARNPVHEYDLAAGQVSATFQVTLTVTRGTGDDEVTDSVTRLVTVSREALDADFAFEVNGTVVTFLDQSSGDPDTFSWDFGDGETSSEQNPVHDYSGSVASGETEVFQVTLTVSRGTGSDEVTDSVTKLVTVTAPD